MIRNLLSKLLLKVYNKSTKPRIYTDIHSSTEYSTQKLDAHKTILNRLSFSNLSNKIHNTLGKSLFLNILTTISIIYTLNEYIVEFIKCQGASMMPTIYPVGDIILIERITADLFGIDGGDSIRERWNSRQTKFKSSGKKTHFKEQLSTISFIIASKKEKIFSDIINNNSINNYSSVIINSLNNLYYRFTSGLHIGDVVVIDHPSHPGTICKRVLGLPGDIVIQPQQKYLRNNRSSGEHFNKEEKNYLLEDVLLSSNLILIPDGHIWVEGDNSINSTDSRNYGPLPTCLVVGKVICRVWPFTKFKFIERKKKTMSLNGELFFGSIVYPAGYDEQFISSHMKPLEFF